MRILGRMSVALLLIVSLAAAGEPPAPVQPASAAAGSSPTSGPVAAKPSTEAASPPPVIPGPTASPDAPSATASPSAILFGKKCAGCHTIGEGDRTGPDLLGVTKRRERAWIESFIPNPGAKIDSGDATANELLQKFKGVRMPEQTFTPDELRGIVDYLDDCGKKGGCKIALGQVRHANQATPFEVEVGRQVFAGLRPLANGGPACISCHNVRGAGILGGGTLAKDLTFVYARLGDAGMTSALETTPFPLMKDAFGKRPLDASEAFALKAYFATVAKDGTPPTPDHNFLYLGVIGLFASLGTIGAVWSGRLRGVRQTIVKRGHR